MSTGIFVDRVYDVKNTDLTGTQRMEKCNELQKFGVDPSVLGTHSLRKGSASYTTSGSTAGPSFSAICQRAGWKLGTVQDRYLKYERASDQYAGRVVCGLPQNEPAFGVLPPHFGASTPEVELQEAIDMCFPTTLRDEQLQFQPILRMCLASLVYHSDWVLQHVSPLRHTRVYSVEGLVERLKPHVVCGNTSTLMTSTGNSL